MLQLLRVLIAGMLVPLILALAMPVTAFADSGTTPPNGTSLPAGTPPPTTTTTVGDLTKPGEIGSGNAKAITALDTMFNAVVDAAATASQDIKGESATSR